jgi:hypothetical protein
MPGQPELKYICVGRSVVFRDAAKKFSKKKKQERNSFDVPVQTSSKNTRTPARISSDAWPVPSNSRKAECKSGGDLSPRHVNMTQWARTASNYIKHIVQHGERALFNDFSSFRDWQSSSWCCELVLFVGCRVDRADAPSSTQAQGASVHQTSGNEQQAHGRSILQVTGSAAGCRRAHDQVSVITCSLRRAALDLPQIPELVGVTSRYKLGYRNVPRHSRGAHAHAVKTPRCLQPPHQHIFSLSSPLRSISALCKV